RPASSLLAFPFTALLFAACATPQTTSNPVGTGGSSGGPMPVMKDPSSYPQNAATMATFPYPQGHASASCTLAIYNTDTVDTAYMNWKAKFFDGTRILRPENSNDTVSEGIGYGMLIGVYMNDK